jgi:signal transduction histidine kinase
MEWLALLFVLWTGARGRLALRLPPLPPDRDRDTTVFRILQESLTNVARHAHAESVDIRCGVSGGALFLEVADDWVGIAEGTAGGPRSLGMLGMRERARAIGAEIDVVPHVPRGTAVRLRVPMEVDGARE